MKYVVIDIQTKKVMSVPMTLVAAHRKADRLDLAYGAVRYTVRPAAVIVILSSPSSY